MTANHYGNEDSFEAILSAWERLKEQKNQEHNKRSRDEGNDKYNPKCPKCGLRVLYCVYGHGSDKIDEFDRRGIMYRHMGCIIPQKEYCYICPNCYIGYDRKLNEI